MDDLDRFVPNVHFEKIPIKNLVSNQDYQRNLSQAHIEKTAENFDIFQINPVKVSRRDGINYVFNGQHTIEIVALASGSRETPVWCILNRLQPDLFLCGKVLHHNLLEAGFIELDVSVEDADD